MFRQTQAILSAALAGLLLPACVNELAPASDVSLEKTDVTKPPLPWGPSDDPDIFSSDLKYRLDELPREGEAASIPWASSYWPTYEDSINFKWDGASSRSPAAKYGEAFGVEGVEDAVSRFRGIDSHASGTACTEDSQCKSELAEKCAKRDGHDEGRCVPTWFGICHAWAPASILVPEPKHPVTVNGVEFKVNDIKALVTLVHDNVVNKFASLRCNDNDGADGIEYDEYGRPKSGHCIDTNPGTFHLLVTNYLGLKRQSFVYDRQYDYQVWNQPIRGFQVTTMREVNAEEANALVGVTSVGGERQEVKRSVERGAFAHLDPIDVEAGKKISVTMTGTGDGDLYVRFGAQPTLQDYDCRPYDSGSAETCELTVPEGQTKLFVSVHGYEASEVDVVIVTGGEAASGYLFNDRARRFFEVRLQVDFISESSPHTDGPLHDDIDRYTYSDRLHYVLELDDQGRVIGGEWLSDSKRNHPDFLWLPVRAALSSVAGGKISYTEVMNLLNRAIGDEQGGEGRERTVDEGGAVTRGQLKHYGPFSVAAGASLVATLSGTGDADLYVRRGAAPTLTSYDCRPYKSGSSESCTVDGPGALYVAVHGYAASSDFDLHVVYREPGESDGDGPTGGEPEPAPEPTPEPSAHLDVSGDVAQGAFAYYELPVEAGQRVVVRTEAPKDVDLYLQFGRQPTTNDYTGIGYTASGNEEVSFTASSSGVLHIGVHGYQASSFRLITADL